MMGSKRPLTPLARMWARYLLPWVKSEAVCLGSSSRCFERMMMRNSRQVFALAGFLLGSSLVRSMVSL